MRIPIVLITVTLFVLSVVGINNGLTSSAGDLFSPIPSRWSHPSGVAPQGATRFSSAYSSLTKCGSGMTKKEEKEAEARGSDIPTRCKGYDGYYIDASYSACASSFEVVKGETNIPLGMQAVDWPQKTVEWRLANGKPFAVIIRFYEYSGGTECALAGKVTGSSLIVKGLKGYEHIDETVEVKGTPNANVKARDLADKGYARPKS